MKFCPHCGKDIEPYLAAESSQPLPPTTAPPNDKYDQSKIWREINAQVNKLKSESRLPSAIELASKAYHDVERLKQTNPAGPGVPFLTVVHMEFDQAITPRGGTLARIAALDGRTTLSVAEIKDNGYALGADQKIVNVDGIPIGPAYQALEYWGGVKQHKRWHMTQPIKLNPSRNGDPLFMDENMLAFGADWRDGSMVHAAFLELCSTFMTGIKEAGRIAYPCQILITSRE